MKNKKTLSPGLTLLIYIIVLAAYSYGVWQIFLVVYPAEKQIVINDLEQRLENCQWQLLNRNAEIEHLTKNQNK